jgi:hypothetical protein
MDKKMRLYLLLGVIFLVVIVTCVNEPGAPAELHKLRDLWVRKIQVMPEFTQALFNAVGVLSLSFGRFVLGCVAWADDLLKSISAGLAQMRSSG